MRLASLLIYLFLLSLPASLAAQKTYGNLLVDSLTNIVDGDTFKCNIKGVHPLIGENAYIRIAGIDTPELRADCPLEKMKAIKAMEFVRKLLTSARIIELRNVQRGSFFRIIADVFADGKNIAALLLIKDLAVPYHGGDKSEWCNDLKQDSLPN